ncbi:NlpC/P60 family protein [Allonocardiopsis opalescens]|uniref:Cell wall-associated NlpC family hydrolase n=1 Tax=Allonocardiopsis opalescens TaxID=1144618 RepID=A0A2T0PSW9_9ACTN|nr:NlpC/P60 family protein [Allonocardiopsis opalescens]PRX91990.1 cell wall-associated NlpC family hydrolase [Allonocardiopsis opalescens]
MPSAGSVHVDVFPDLRRFGPQLRRDLQREVRALRVDVPVHANTRQASQALAGLRRRAEGLNAVRPRIQVRAETVGAVASLRAVDRIVSRLDGRRIRIHMTTTGAAPTLPTVTPPRTPRTQTAPSGSRGSQYQQPFTDSSPAQQAAVATLVPPAIPAVGALAGGLGAVASGGAAAAAGVGAFALALIPAIANAREAAATGGQLTGQQAQFTAATDRMTAAWQGFRARTDGAVLVAASRSVDVATEGLDLLEPVANSTAGAVATLGVEARAALGTPEWQRFFAFVQRQAYPSTLIFGRSLGNLGTGVAGLVTNFEPLWNVVGPGLEGMSATFARWGQDSSNFTEFIQWTIDNGPVFVGTLGDLAGAAVDIGVAVAPLGTVYAQGLGLLASSISAVAEQAPWLIQFAVAVGTARVALGLLGRVNSGLIQPLRELPGRVRDFASGLGQASMQASSAAGGVGRFRGAVSGVVGALGGPWGLAITGAVAALGLFISTKAAATAEVDRFVEAIRQDNGAIGTHSREVIAATIAAEGLVAESARLGLELDLVTDALLGNTAAQREVNQAIQDGIAADAAYLQQHGRSRDGAAERQLAAHNLTAAIEGQNATIAEAVQRYQDEQAASAALGLQADTTGTSITGLALSQGGLNTALQMGTGSAQSLRTALDLLTQTNLTVAQSELAWHQALTGATEAIDANGASTDLNTAAGQANRASLLQLAQAATGHINAMREQDSSAEDLIATSRRQREAFIRVAQEMGYTEDAANDLADEYLGIPSEVETAIRVNARGVWTLGPSSDGYDPWANNPVFGDAVRRAEGGPIFGPGTTTSDSVPVLASQGEHMLTAAEVEAAGGHQGVYALRAAIRSGQFGQPIRRARGGPIERDALDLQAVDELNDHRVDVRLQYQRLIAGALGHIAHATAQQIRRYMSEGGLGALARAVSQQGVPYSWGGGGPGGPSFGFGRGANIRGFDCSSLMQYAWWPWVQLPRVTYSQIESGMPVPVGAQQPGDLVFPNRGHVAMYAGGGRLFHTFRTGEVAGYRSMYPNPLAIRRPMRGMAIGGRASAGEMALVGEEGPELVRFTSAAEVYSNEQTRELMRASAAYSAMGGGRHGDAPLVGTLDIDVHDSSAGAREIAEEITHAIRKVRHGGRYAVAD